MTVLFGPLGPSLAPQVRKSATLYRWFKPFALWYANIAGYRKIGLKYDDLLLEERDDVQRAIGRLTPREALDRTYRFRRAHNCSMLHRDLPKEQWLKPEEDVRYLKSHVEDVWKEDLERKKWDTIEVERKR